VILLWNYAKIYIHLYKVFADYIVNSYKNCCGSLKNIFSIVSFIESKHFYLHVAKAG